MPISGVPLENDDNESFGQITFTQALAKSVNTVWAQVAEHVGKPTMARYMRRFGFGRKPQLDYPAEEMSASGPYSGTRLISPLSPQVDVGRMGIGQDKLEVTPLQMAEVAAAVANRGRLMVPHMTDRIVEPDGRTVKRIAPRVQSVVMKPSTAAAVRSMMEAVVQEGTGTAAQIPGVQVAGKTGTAETQIGDGDQQRLVHRVRAGGGAEGGGRCDVEGRAGTGRRVRCADRTPGDRKAAACLRGRARGWLSRTR